MTAGVLGLGMFFYFLFLPGNGLKSILCHLFGAWTTRYLILGIIGIVTFIQNKEFISLEVIRFITTFFVMIEFSALFRLYLYINKKNG